MSENHATYASEPEQPQPETQAASFAQPEPDPADQLDPTYVQENVEYYRAQYRNYKKFGTTDFNWAAFFFSGWWCFYRKLYVLGILMIVANYVPGLGLIANFFSGFLGNRWYFQEMDRNLAVGDRTGAGVNKWIIYVGIVVSVLFFLAICACSALFVGSVIGSSGYSDPTF